jgi:hypothetical protein
LIRRYRVALQWGLFGQLKSAGALRKSVPHPLGLCGLTTDKTAPKSLAEVETYLDIASVGKKALSYSVHAGIMANIIIKTQCKLLQQEVLECNV